MTVINTNTASINAQYNLNKVNKEMESAMEALSSGKRINSAADDAAGMSIATRMESQIRGLNQAMRNAADGQSLIDTAEGAMDEITNMLQRVRELALQSANDTMSDTDRTNLNNEVDQLITEIDRVASTTKFNDINLLDGSFSGSFQVGSNSSETMAVSIGNLSTTALGTSLSGVVGTAAVSNEASGTAAISTISQLAFNGNDSYTFDVVVGIDDTPANNITLSVSNAAMVAGNADAIKTALQSAINTAVGAGDLAEGDISVEVNSNVLTITNSLGGSVAVDGFSSTGSGTAQFQSVSGDGDNIQLGGAGAAVVAANNAGGSTASVASETLSLQQGSSYSFRLQGTLIEINNLDGGGANDTSRTDVVTQLSAAIGNTANVGASLAGDDVTFTIANTDGADMSITNFNAVSSPAGSAGEMTLAMRIDANSSASDNSFANDGADWSYLDGSDVAQLTFSEEDANYSFDIDGNTFTVKTTQDDGTEVTLAEALVITKNAINTAAGAGGALDGEIAARITDGKLEIENLSNQLTGSKGTISFAVTTDAGDIHDTDESTAVTLNDGLDFNTVRNGDTVTLTFDEDTADYEFRLTGLNGSGALGADIPVSIKTESANKTLAQALADTATLLSSNSNMTVTSTATELVIEYDAYAGNPTIKNELGQDLEASYTLNSDDSADETSLVMNFTEAYADYSFDLSDTILSDEKFSVVTSDGTSLAEAVANVATAINAASTAGDVVATAVGGQLTLTAANDTDITLEDMETKLGPLKIDNFSSTGSPHVNSLKIDNFISTGKPEVTAGDVATGSGVDIIANSDLDINGSEAVASQSFLTVTGDDTYSFELDSGLAGTSAATITATVDGGDLNGLINAINAQSDTTGVTAKEESGSITLTQAEGNAISLAAFDSTGAGTIRVTHAAGQAGVGEGAGIVLNDDASVEDAATAAAGLATATTMELTASGDDEFSFKISDGISTAVVRKTAWDADGGADILAEINKALASAGSDITAANASGVITLTNALGGAIEISEFTSESTETMTASPGSGQGVGKILDDTGQSASGSAVAAINLSSQEGANTALDIVDAALENINSQRSELGAMSNRLDHTISNLGNVVVNTEASQSRIQDADFAKVTGELTKAQIMSQAATAMLAQANASKQGVLSLLQG